MTLRRLVVGAHRSASIAAALFWIVQSVTGIIAVFHWEIDDATVAGEHRPTDLEAIERRIEALVQPASGDRVDSIWTTAGAPDRYDVYIDSTGARGRVVRVDGAGNVLRTRTEGERSSAGGAIDGVVEMHHSLLAGEGGHWIVGASGVLLLSNLMLGAIAGWPRRRQWRAALLPAQKGSALARLYAAHRALGLWLAIPAIFLVSAGALLAFDDRLERLLGAGPVRPVVDARPGTARVGLADAAATAAGRYPGAVIAGIGFPSEESAVWSVTLRQEGELRQPYGRTRVFVSAVDGTIVGTFDPLTAAPADRFVSALFALHTGQFAGVVGRVAAIAIGIWLMAMIAIGLALWRQRKRGRAATGRRGVASRARA